MRFLYVDMHQRWEPGTASERGCTYVTARPGRDAIADLRAAYELSVTEEDRLDKHAARGADQPITSAIDTHVQAEQRGDEDDGGQAGALTPANGPEDQ